MFENAEKMKGLTTLEGAVVVITGAGRGIGRAIALELGQGGANIVVNYAHSKESAEELVRWLREHGSQQAVAPSRPMSLIQLRRPRSSMRQCSVLGASMCSSIMQASISIDH
jgi:NAD(P)-dependent dehydrogenase (short-subunit alcohol dehydrogenase family)